MRQIFCNFVIGLLSRTLEQRFLPWDPSRGATGGIVRHKTSYHDVEIWLDSGVARMRNGRVVSFRFGVANHIVALAFISA
jgi:hypothetical protein